MEKQFDKFDIIAYAFVAVLSGLTAVAGVVAAIVKQSYHALIPSAMAAVVAFACVSEIRKMLKENNTKS